MRLTKALILLLSFIAILAGCQYFEPTPTVIVGRPQAFEIQFSEAMDIQTALDTSNYTVISSEGDTITISKIKFVSQVLTDSGWVTRPHNCSVALFPVKPLYSGAYLIEIWDLEDEAGNVIDPNPTRIKVKYYPKEMRVQ